MEFSQYYALGARLDAEGRFDEAFAAYAQANALQRRPEEAARAEAEEVAALDEVGRTFSPDFFRRNYGGDKVNAPIFVVGMPRTGTTLIEQILDSHPLVKGMGETDALQQAVGLEYPMDPRRPAYPDHYATLARHYLRRMRRAGWNGAGRIVDKQVSNRWLLGLARVMFPKSTMIHTVRDPLDTCLSIFLVQFTQGMPLANDLAEIGRQYVRYRAVIDYWVREMPGAFIHINHEALVADPERGIRELVEMCELPWSDECLRFYENTRAVETASAQQVRRPISGERVGRWRNYEKHLGPLIEALGPYVSEARTDLRPTG